MSRVTGLLDKCVFSHPKDFRVGVSRKRACTERKIRAVAARKLLDEKLAANLTSLFA